MIQIGSSKLVAIEIIFEKKYMKISFKNKKWFQSQFECVSFQFEVRYIVSEIHIA